ncbi:glycosyltransferase family 4 protein [Protaetiibacter mangrovi]|uniref:Glycosyltransferase family 4 protein n=1 Tax=Protaetiibacter mangrovi TaxID=2970926 RepID=A0ABT1ZBG8_9MICO|nr:glycosyltransferase family 4 protein [Protaetiibacter mangrovi]MCS0498052.1 glycosyltransferase family 4 protein [Protaetiibacter mangrovi]TPX04001.1 glycosyltransferase family 4 protein [Schumannella luteola]
MTSYRGSESNGRLSVVYSFPHAIGAPGIGWTAWNQVTELVAAGHEVHLVSASVARPIPGLASDRRVLQRGRVRIPHRAVGRDRAFAFHDRIGAELVRRVRPDVVHTWPLAAERTLRAAAEVGAPGLREAPNTHTAHAYQVVAEECARLGVELPADASHAANAAHLAREEREWAAAAAVLAPSDAVARSFVARGHDPERILRHRYGARSDGAPAAPRRSDDPPVVLFLGRVEPRKGLHHALRAWAGSRLRDSGRFVVHGDPIPTYAAVLAPLLDQPGVEMRGFTRDPGAALAAADVLVLPTVEEGSALVTYEAQLAGCVPLVSTAAGAYLDDGVHGLLHEPGDVDALRAQFDLLADHPEEFARMSAAAAAHAPELSWEAAGRSLVAAYRAAIARRGGAVHAVAE